MRDPPNMLEIRLVQLLTVHHCCCLKKAASLHHIANISSIIRGGAVKHAPQHETSIALILSQAQIYLKNRQALIVAMLAGQS